MRGRVPSAFNRGRGLGPAHAAATEPGHTRSRTRTHVCTGTGMQRSHTPTCRHMHTRKHPQRHAPHPHVGNSTHTHRYVHARCHTCGTTSWAGLAHSSCVGVSANQTGTCCVAPALSPPGTVARACGCRPCGGHWPARLITQCLSLATGARLTQPRPTSCWGRTEAQGWAATSQGQRGLSCPHVTTSSPLAPASWQLPAGEGVAQGWGC